MGRDMDDVVEEERHLNWGYCICAHKQGAVILTTNKVYALSHIKMSQRHVLDNFSREISYFLLSAT
jgi:hypothetical protein